MKPLCFQCAHYMEDCWDCNRRITSCEMFQKDEREWTPVTIEKFEPVKAGAAE